jgi:hypothetical protein
MKIGILGDIYAGQLDSTNPNYSAMLNDYAKSSILPTLNKLDYVIGNLEAPITISDKPILKTGPAIKNDNEVLKLLELSKIGIVTLANNHIFDFGELGIKDTLKICEQNNISTFGAGLDKNKITSPFNIKFKDKTISFINFAENEFNTIDLKTRSIGSNNLDIIEISRQILLAKTSADYVILISHGGHEEFEFPSPRIKKLYRFLTEIGADAIIAHHPHVAQGYEIFNEKPIFYSLGNYFFPSLAQTKINQIGYGVILDFTKEKLCFEIIPYKQCSDGFQVNCLEGTEKKNFLDHLAKITEIILDDIKLELKWKEFVESRKINFHLSLIPISKKIAYRLINFKFFYKLIPDNYFIKLLNLIRCESHRDVLISTLKQKVYGADLK